MKTDRLLAALRAACCALFVMLGAKETSAQSAIATDNKSALITTGNTFQQIQAANQSRRSITIENNNTSSDNCWVNIDGSVAAGNTTSTSVTPPGGNGTMTAAQASILLQAGGSYQRYYPYIPQGPIIATCASTGDSLYVDVQ